MNRLNFIQTRAALISTKSLKSWSFHLSLLTTWIIIYSPNNQMDRKIKGSYGHWSNQASPSGLTFSRKHHLLLRSAFPPSWYPGMGPEDEGRLVGGVGLEGEDTWEDGSAGQRLLHRRTTDPAHVHNRGGCSRQRTSREHLKCLKCIFHVWEWSRHSPDTCLLLLQLFVWLDV